MNNTEVVCAWCGEPILDKQGNPIYKDAKGGKSHSICKDCIKKYFGEYDIEDISECMT